MAKVSSSAPQILVVDDEPMLREIMVEDLEFEGYAVDQAGSGDEAFNMLSHEPGRFQVVLSDIRMPDGTGVELVERIMTQIENPPPVILISGFADITEAEALQCGAKRLFKKPFDNQEILEFIKSLL